MKHHREHLKIDKHRNNAHTWGRMCVCVYQGTCFQIVCTCVYMFCVCMYVLSKVPAFGSTTQCGSVSCTTAALCIECWPRHTYTRRNLTRSVAGGFRNAKTQGLFLGLGVLHWQFLDELLFSMAMSTYSFLSAAWLIWDTELSQGTETAAECYQVV